MWPIHDEGLRTTFFLSGQPTADHSSKKSGPKKPARSLTRGATRRISVRSRYTALCYRRVRDPQPAACPLPLALVLEVDSPIHMWPIHDKGLELAALTQNVDAVLLV